jgi:tetratricopeptide (TPR) repeat protein
LWPIVFALLAQTAFALIFFGRYYIASALEAVRLFPAYVELFRSPVVRWSIASIFSFIGAAVTTILIGLVFVPVATFVSARRTGRASLATNLQRHYVPAAAALFSALGLAYVWGIAIDLTLRSTGVIAFLVQKMVPILDQTAKEKPEVATLIESIGRESLASMVWLEFFLVPGVIVALWWALRIAFDSSWARAFVSLAVAGLATLSIQSLFGNLFGAVAGAVILALMSFVVLRAYFLNTVERQRVTLHFVETVRAADAAPHDAHAQAELGRLLMERGELGPARERFERAIEHHPQDWSAQFHLGRIARREGRWAEAIAYFEPVVANEFDHSQYEIWREVGGTYLGAGQYGDAAEALEKFLDHRPHDAEGWCLLGQAQAGLGNQIEAAAAMHACVTAVEGLPEPDEQARGWRLQAENYLRSVGR